MPTMDDNPPPPTPCEVYNALKSLAASLDAREKSGLNSATHRIAADGAADKFMEGVRNGTVPVERLHFRAVFHAHTNCMVHIRRNAVGGTERNGDRAPQGGQRRLERPSRPTPPRGGRHASGR